MVSKKSAATMAAWMATALLVACGGTEPTNPDPTSNVEPGPVNTCNAPKVIENGNCVDKQTDLTDQQRCEANPDMRWDGTNCNPKTPIANDCDKYSWMGGVATCRANITDTVDLEINAMPGRCVGKNNASSFFQTVTIVDQMTDPPQGEELIAVPMDGNAGYTVWFEGGFGGVESFDCTK